MTINSCILNLFGNKTKPVSLLSEQICSSQVKMDEGFDSLQALNQLSANVTERDKIIWENEARQYFATKQTAKLREEIDRMKQSTKEMEEEDEQLEIQLKQLTDLISIKQESLQMNEQTLLNQELLIVKLTEEMNEMKETHRAVLKQYDEEYEKHLQRYKNSSPAYQELRKKEINLKMLKIKEADLKVKIKNCIIRQKKLDDIQKQRGHSIIVNFAKNYVAYQKREKSRLLLEERKRVEKALLEQHLALEKSAKLQQQRDSYGKNTEKFQNYLQDETTTSQLPIKEETIVPETNILNIQSDVAKEEIKKSMSDKFQDFLTEELTLVASSPEEITEPEPLKDLELPSLKCTSINTTEPNFNEDNSKVRILESRIIKKPNVRKTNEDLASKMLAIVQNTKEALSRTNSLQVNTTTLTDSVKTQVPTFPKSIKETTPPTTDNKENVPVENQSATTDVANLQLNKDKLKMRPILRKDDEKCFSQPTENITRSKFFAPSDSRKTVTFRASEIDRHFSQPIPTVKENIFQKQAPLSNFEERKERPACESFVSPQFSLFNFADDNSNASPIIEYRADMTPQSLIDNSKQIDDYASAMEMNTSMNDSYFFKSPLSPLNYYDTETRDVNKNDASFLSPTDQERDNPGLVGAAQQDVGPRFSFGFRGQTKSCFD